MLLALEEPFFRVSSCCDRRSQLTRGAFSFPIPQFRIWPAALIGIFLAVDRPDMRRIFIGIWSPDSKILSMCIDPFSKSSQWKSIAAPVSCLDAHDIGGKPVAIAAAEAPAMV